MKRIFFTITFLGIIAGVLLTIHLFARHKSTRDQSDDGRTEFVAAIEFAAVPFSDISDFGKIIDKAQNAKYVLLGESSHGTKEYYSLRAEISKELIRQKGFKFIAVEGNWVQLYEANKYVKGLPEAKGDAHQALSAYKTWPEWMWANKEFADFIQWLAEYNSALPQKERVGVYGMDLQGMRDSLDKTIELLQKTDPKLYALALENYSCFDSFGEDPSEYMKYTIQGENCINQVDDVVRLIKETFEEEMLTKDAALFKLKQNALAVKYGELYYRTHAQSGTSSWNERVRYMKQTLERLSDFYGDGSKGIVWAHNTHVGDARATEMAEKGLVNIGQLLRQDFGHDEIFILGFSTYRGSVIAGRQWGQERQIMDVPNAISGSADELLSKAGIERFYVLFNENGIPDAFYQSLGHRAKGVVYNPEREHLGNYVPTVLPQRYNALVFIRETSALTPL